MRAYVIHVFRFTDCCRNSEEVETVLKQGGGGEFGDRIKFPRLSLAVDLNQKEFVAHPNTQSVIAQCSYPTTTQHERIDTVINTTHRKQLGLQETLKRVQCWRRDAELRLASAVPKLIFHFFASGR